MVGSLLRRRAAPALALLCLLLAGCGGNRYVRVTSFKNGVVSVENSGPFEQAWVLLDVCMEEYDVDRYVVNSTDVGTGKIIAGTRSSYRRNVLATGRFPAGGTTRVQVQGYSGFGANRCLHLSMPTSAVVLHSGTKESMAKASEE
ncbi:MAG TPA: hypothetical protein PK280_19600 [Planctomycetota bacterium]|nr:hypothetical protein [Planctomycetota bacterium]